MQISSSKQICRSLVALPVLAILAGCGPRDADPQAKVDAPGYYNGDMKAKNDETASQPVRKGNGVALGAE